MEVICLQEPAFYQLIEKVIAHIQQSTGESNKKWISTEEAMNRLNIKSKTTLQKLRDEASIRFSQPEKKWIVYDSDSIDAYLAKHSH